jgi:hypothetical protein
VNPAPRIELALWNRLSTDDDLVAAMVELGCESDPLTWAFCGSVPSPGANLHPMIVFSHQAGSFERGGCGTAYFGRQTYLLKLIAAEVAGKRGFQRLQPVTDRLAALVDGYEVTEGGLILRFEQAESVSYRDELAGKPENHSGFLVDIGVRPVRP